MRLGYYYADGRYGDHFAEQRAHTNLYRVSRSGWYGDPRGETAAAVASIARPVAAGMDLQLALDIGSRNVGGEGWKPYLRAVLAELGRLGADARVGGIELRDEPSWEEEEARQKAEAVRAALGGRLAGAALGVTLAAQDVLVGVARRYSSEAGYGFVGCEAYLEPGTWTAEQAHGESARLVRRMNRKLAAGVACWVVGMSYDRNGAFGPAAALKAVQHGTYEGAKAVGARALVWFSFGRPGGVETYPGLRREHRAISRAEGILV